MKKFGIFLIILIIAIVTTIAIVLNMNKTKESGKIKNAKIEVTLVEDLKIKFLEEKHVSDFITSINGNIVDDYVIDTTQVGDKLVKFEFVNDEGIQVPYEYTIKVYDDVPPLIWLSGSYSITVGDDVDIVANVVCGDNDDDDPVRTIEGEYDYNKVGSYPLVFKATDKSGNVSEKKFTLYVNEKTSGTTKKPTTKTYTKYSDVISNHKTSKTKIGLDVSSWQEDIDFEAIKNAGVEFLMIRVGSKKGTNGEYFLDSRFINNIKKANEYGIDAGLYFYSYAASVEEAKKDAEWLLEQIDGYDILLPIAYDWEDWGKYNNYHMSFYKLTSCANAFLSTIEEHGYKGMLYGSATYLENFWMPTKYDTWLAHYTKQTNYKGDYIMWQICSNGLINGINGEVDIDIMYLK